MIGYYVHHQGGGHLARARCIAARMREPVVVLSSLAAPSDTRQFAGWIQLSRDDSAGGRAHTGGGALHWAPLDVPGYAERMQTVSRWIASAGPRLVVVDVSVEIAALVRLLGVPVVVVAGPGDRVDDPHQLAYRLAEHIIAPWFDAVYRPGHLAAFVGKVSYVGAMSRFDAEPVEPAPGVNRVLALFGQGGSRVSQADVDSAAAATPAWSWRNFGAADMPWSSDLWAELMSSDVIVCHGGQNILAEVAAARRPALVVPQDRPFGEQDATATAIQQSGIAQALSGWPEPSAWPALLTAAAGLGGHGWKRWSDGAGAARAAAAIDAVGRS